MKSRAKIKENRRLKREQLLDTRDFCGIKDPTPYEAVKSIINKERAAASTSVRI
jgi:hypothetical protein